MDDGPIGFAYDGRLPELVAQVVVWLVVVVACAVAVRRPWAWFGLPGGLLGLAVAATLLADDVQVRSDLSRPSAHVFDESFNFPGFLADHPDLDDVLTLVQTAGLALVAAAFVVGAVLARRRDRPAAA